MENQIKNTFRLSKEEVNRFSDFIDSIGIYPAGECGLFFPFSSKIETEESNFQFIQVEKTKTGKPLSGIFLTDTGINFAYVLGVYSEADFAEILNFASIKIKDEMSSDLKEEIKEYQDLETYFIRKEDILFMTEI